MSSENPERDYLLVVAIDFGTTFSGYAFSFRNTDDNPSLSQEIKMNKNWGADLGFEAYKTVTSVLLGENNEFIAFGYDAEKKFAEMSHETDDNSDYDEEEGHRATVKKAPSAHLYRHFKMMLTDIDKRRRKPTLTSLDGRVADATLIFAHALGFMKDHLLGVVKKEHHIKTLTANDIRWVITVPAIWSENAKQFMRHAAFKAKFISSLDSDKLVIALEPEAASIFCRQEHLAQYESRNKLDVKPGTKYIVVDCGGGTVDVAVHEIQSDKTVAEVSVVSGGPWGGTAVDKKFEQALENLFGKDFINSLKQESTVEWLDIITNFEKTKKTVKPDGKSKISVRIGHEFSERLAIKFGKRVEEVIKNSKDKNYKFSSGNLRIGHGRVMEFFSEAVKQTVQHVRTITRQPEVLGARYILMVGGFSECAVLQHAMQKEFSDTGIEVLKPSEAELAIVKGAVAFGHERRVIKSRRSRYTYGSAVSAPYNPAIHDEFYVTTDSFGRKRVQDILNVFVEKGEEVNYSEKREFTINAKPNYNEEIISILRYDKKPDTPVQYINVAGMSEAGSITISTPQNIASSREICIAIEFGGTEMKVSATFKATGKKANTKISFGTL